MHVKSSVSGSDFWTPSPRWEKAERGLGLRDPTSQPIRSFPPLSCGRDVLNFTYRFQKFHFSLPSFGRFTANQDIPGGGGPTRKSAHRPSGLCARIDNRDFRPGLELKLDRELQLSGRS